MSFKVQWLLQASSCYEEKQLYKNNVMVNAYVIWKEDKKENFTLEHAWRLLKNQPRWLE